MIAAWGVALGVALAPAAGAGEPPASGRKVEDRRAICMMQDTLQQKAGIPYAYNGKTYYLCCEGCRAAVERDPERYTHATDPVNGERVDKADAPIYAYRGHAYYFSSADTLAAFAKTPEKYLRGAASAPPPRQTP
jgi:Cu+-exporting ATPase